jgi:plastocyanin
MSRHRLKAVYAICILVSAAGVGRAAGGIQVRISDLEFTPVEVAAHVGDRIIWVNEDFIAHTASDGMGTFDLVLAPGESRELKLPAPGIITYICRFHPNMTGRITVRGNETGDRGK